MKAVLGLLASALAAACAHVEQLPDGSRRVTGLVRLTVPASIPEHLRGGESLQVTTVGVLILSSPGASSVQLGYASDRIISVRNNALVEFHERGEQP